MRPLCLLPTLLLKKPDLWLHQRAEENTVLWAPRGSLTESQEKLSKKLLKMMTLSYEC